MLCEGWDSWPSLCDPCAALLEEVCNDPHEGAGCSPLTLVEQGPTPLPLASKVLGCALGLCHSAQRDGCSRPLSWLSFALQGTAVQPPPLEGCKSLTAQRELMGTDGSSGTGCDWCCACCSMTCLLITRCGAPAAAAAVCVSLCVASQASPVWASPPC